MLVGSQVPYQQDCPEKMQAAAKELQVEHFLLYLQRESIRTRTAATLKGTKRHMLQVLLVSLEGMKSGVHPSKSSIAWVYKAHYGKGIIPCIETWEPANIVPTKMTTSQHTRCARLCKTQDI